MAKINARNKGANGEREAAEWLYKNLNMMRLPERNLEQVRHGGSDLLHTEPLCVEVKRCEAISLNPWWRQVTKAVEENEIPVVMFRTNGNQWEFLLPAYLIGAENGYVRVDRFVFKRYALQHFPSEMTL